MGTIRCHPCVPSDYRVHSSWYHCHLCQSWAIGSDLEIPLQRLGVPGIGHHHRKYPCFWFRPFIYLDIPWQRQRVLRMLRSLGTRSILGSFRFHHICGWPPTIGPRVRGPSNTLFRSGLGNMVRLYLGPWECLPGQFPRRRSLRLSWPLWGNNRRSYTE